MKKLLLLLLITVFALSCKSAYDNMVVNAYGTARNSNGKPMLVGYEGTHYYLEGMEAWPEADTEKKFTVTGKLTRKGNKRIIKEAKIIGDGKEEIPADMQACKKNFYRGRVLNPYKVYKADTTKDTLLLKLSDINAITNLFRQQHVVTAIDSIKQNNIFLEMAAKYSHTNEHDATTLYDYAKQYIDTPQYESYKNNFWDLDSFMGNFFTHYPEVLHVLLYSNFKEYGDCYFYERGYDGFKVVQVSNPIVESVLYGKQRLNKYKNNYFGLEVRQTGQIITIPIVSDGNYICDVRLIVCRG